MKGRLYRIATLGFLCIMNLPLLAQTVSEHRKCANPWETYIARYDAGLGATTVNMRQSFRDDLPFVVVTGVNFEGCTGEGFPTAREVKRLRRVSEDINAAVFQHTQAVLVGTFIYQCQQLEYIYVSDTVGLRRHLDAFSRRKLARYYFHLRMSDDPTWEVYRDFLYPGEAVVTFMRNSKAMADIRDQGDPLSRPRFLEHLIYFNDSDDRERFIRYIGRLNYDIKDERVVRRDSMKYQLRLARFSMITLDALNSQTNFLKQKASQFGGRYEGWETVVRRRGDKELFRLLNNPATALTNSSK